MRERCDGCERSLSREQACLVRHRNELLKVVNLTLCLDCVLSPRLQLEDSRRINVSRDLLHRLRDGVLDETEGATA